MAQLIDGGLLILISGGAASGGSSTVVVAKSGAVDPALFKGRKKHRCVLPDGSICYATKDEMRAILAKLASEYKDVERKIVPTIKRERKTAILEETDFPQIKPQIRVLRKLEVPQFDLPPEEIVRAYIESSLSRKRRKDEEEWLLMIVH